MTRPIRLNENQYVLSLEATADAAGGIGGTYADGVEFRGFEFRFLGSERRGLATASAGGRVCAELYRPRTTNGSGEFAGIGGSLCYGVAYNAQGRVVHTGAARMNVSLHDHRLQIPIGFNLNFREEDNGSLRSAGEINVGFRSLLGPGVLRAPSSHLFWGMELGLGLIFGDNQGELYVRIGINGGIEFDL